MDSSVNYASFSDLCGKRVEFAKHGHRSLGDLLSSHPEKFSCAGGRWFGKVTEDNANIIRAMATEKAKRGRGALRARVFGQGSRPFTPRSAALVELFDFLV
ncbi:hypothetical protein ANCCAN_30019 [Ancylostoma caninum]|uniref:Uncharacterized protein n=1 Tax=Ancylostoma caninum TaxID=29170 RepID=A0A368EZR3_ANCCA|nr:hypothetical protein ANCCAN_30019 [Ancylostoma caninum]